MNIHIAYMTCANNILFFDLYTCKVHNFVDTYIRIYVHLCTLSYYLNVTQLDAYDLLSQQPSTSIMAENKCRELLGTALSLA